MRLTYECEPLTAGHDYIGSALVCSHAAEKIGIAYLGFQSESIKQSLEAPMRFRPTPPAFELSKKRTFQWVRRAGRR